MGRKAVVGGVLRLDNRTDGITVISSNIQMLSTYEIGYNSKSHILHVLLSAQLKMF